MTDSNKRYKQAVNIDSSVVGFVGEDTSPNLLVNINELNEATNVVVGGRGRIDLRKGTTLSLYVNTVDENARTGFNIYKVNAFNTKIAIAKIGTSFAVLRDNNGFNSVLSVKSNIINNSLSGTPGLFTSYLDDNKLFFIWLCSSCQPLVFIVTNVNAIITSASASGITATINEGAPANNYLNSNNTALLNGSDYVSFSSLSQTNTTITATGVNLTFTVGQVCKCLYVFYGRGCDASVYPVNYIYQSAVRRNSVPLDVNVSIPNELTGSFIKNESLPNINSKPYNVFRSSALPLTEAVKVSTQTPATDNEWDFSDGSYRPAAGQRTVRADGTIAFGALEAGGNVVRVHFNRQRELQVNNKIPVPQASLYTYLDKTAVTPTYYDSSHTVTVDNPTFFTVNLAQGNVIEVVYTINNTTVAVPDQRVIDLSLSRPIINDTIVVPFYGLSLMSKVSSNSYPVLATTLGNRLYMTDTFSGLLFGSNNNWSYRGISFNNFQLDTVEFSSTSVVNIRLDADIIGLSSAGNSLIAATQGGIYRVFSSQGLPTADTLTIRKVSDKVISHNRLLSVDYKLYVVDNESLYQINYNRDSDDLSTEDVCPALSSVLSKYTPTYLAYSNYYNSLLVGFNNNFVYMFDTNKNTLTKLGVAAGGNHRLYKTIDGLTIPVNGDGLSKLALLTFSNYNNDCSLNNYVTGNTVVGRQATITELPYQTKDTFLSPALHLASTIPNLMVSELPSSVAAVGTPSVLVTETAASSLLPTDGYPVTGYIQGTLTADIDRATRSFKMTIAVLTENTNPASLELSLLPIRRMDDYKQQPTWLFDLGSVSSVVGEALLNYNYVLVPRGQDGITYLTVPLVGVGRGFQYAMKITNCTLLGVQLASNVKGRVNR